MSAPVIRIPKPPLESYNPRPPENELQEFQVAALVDSISRTVKEKLEATKHTEGATAKLIEKLTEALRLLNE